MAPSFEESVRDLENPDRHARCRAASALGQGGDPRALGPLLRALEDRAADVRAKAAAALARLRDPAAIPAPALVKAVGDDKVSVRAGASAALKKFGKRAYQPLLDAYREAPLASRAALIAVLTRFKTPAVTELLLAALITPDLGLRSQVIRALARRKERRAVDPLLALLAEARATLERVRTVGHPADSRGPTPEWSWAFSQAHCVIRALGEIRDGRVFTPLWEWLELGEPHVHAALMPEIVRALRTIDNARAVDLLHEMLDDVPPENARLPLTLAGMDLMGAAQSLRGAADPGVLFQALQAAGAVLGDVVSRQQEADSPPDPEELARDSTERIRELEATLRNLRRGH